MKHVRNVHFFTADGTFIEYSNRNFLEILFQFCFRSARALLSIKIFLVCLLPGEKAGKRLTMNSKSGVLRAAPNAI